MHLFWRLVKNSLSSLSPLAITITVHAILCNAQVKDCDKEYGRPLDKSRCEVALSNLPRGALPSIFTTRRKTGTNNFVQVPKRYVDATRIPACAITVDLDGHSQHDVFVLVPWNSIRLIAAEIIEECVGIFTTGGISTYGLNQTFEAFIAATPYDPSINAIRAEPASVLNPDGSIDSVAIPAEHRDGISESSFPCSILSCSPIVHFKYSLFLVLIL